MTLSLEALRSPYNIWLALDGASLGAFATVLPAREVLDARGPYATTPWFAAAGAFSPGSFIASRLELALLREFRAAADADGRLARLTRATAALGEEGGGGGG